MLSMRLPGVKGHGAGCPASGASARNHWATAAALLKKMSNAFEMAAAKA